MDMYEDRSYRTNFAVGLLSIAVVIGLAVVVAFFLSKESPLSTRYPLRVRFSDVAGLKVGAPVTLMGANVGRVEALTLSDADAAATAWVVRLAIRDEPWIRQKLTTETTFTVQPESVFGNKYVNATFGDGGTPLETNALVQGAVGAGIDARTFSKLSVALENLSGAAAELRTLLAAPQAGTATAAGGAPNIREVVQNLDKTLANASAASEVLKEALSSDNQAKVKQTFDDLSKSAANLSNVTDRMKTGMDSWAETMEKMRFWRGWFGNGDKEKEEKAKEEARRKAQ